MTRTAHFERHFVNRVGWLRAAVLGANDGIVSLSTLLVGVLSARVTRQQAVLVGVAGLVGGAMSMAAGEYVSVSSQADSERADLERERRELAADEASERKELAAIYVERGLTPMLAEQVAVQLMQHDALGAHAREELGLSSLTQARPLQAASASALSFALGALLPLLVVLLGPMTALSWVIAASSLLFLAALGAMAARVGGAPLAAAASRVTFWGAVAMAVTAGIGTVFGHFD